MQLMDHDEFMALEGPVLFTEHFMTEKHGYVTYSNISALMMRDEVIDGTHFESILIDSSVQQIPIGFDEPLEPWVIKGYKSPNKMYRVFTHDDVRELITNLQQILEGNVK